MLIGTVHDASERLTCRFRSSTFCWSMKYLSLPWLTVIFAWINLEWAWNCKREIYDLYSSAVIRAKIRKNVVDRSFLFTFASWPEIEFQWNWDLKIVSFSCLYLCLLYWHDVWSMERLFLRVNPYWRVNKSRFVPFDEEFTCIQKDNSSLASCSCLERHRTRK